MASYADATQLSNWNQPSQQLSTSFQITNMSQHSERVSPSDQLESQIGTN
jgi:hypothetical protein